MGVNQFTDMSSQEFVAYTQSNKVARKGRLQSKRPIGPNHESYTKQLPEDDSFTGQIPASKNWYAEGAETKPHD